ncbi:hypothetical protein GALMADRAFT_79879 [Galerina marginata CBS 339.88]|uniref:Peroxidase n=1 Tax=Galerina marginata (strain CBS 339.88) TaxID=685588 RepID=A0A067SL28_GALM3|nr:hypothetical protein GALMADRAFT_79879 [Galerina marginata CBS 339.88]
MVLSSFVVVSSFIITISAYTWPSPQYDALEKLLYEGSDISGVPIASITRGCATRGQPAEQKSTVAAEWLRLAYHDMATHNITDGTGGLDASIFFELNRPENIGAGMSDSVGDFQFSATKYISRADIIAMGAVWAVASCKGPSIPYRGGRIDAKGSGRLGVPEPQQDLASHTESFRLQGFLSTEMISLVACGHTLGGVRSLHFPNIVEDKRGNVLSTSTFDTTDAFDSAVLVEYLDSSTMNPLIRVVNTTLASDLRIFSSDGNVTMKSLNSESAFLQACTTLLEKMINTVPSNVTLTDEIKLLPAKVTDAQITVCNSQLIFQTMLRLSHLNTVSTPKNRKVKLFWCDKRGQFKDCASITNVASAPESPPVEVSPLTESQSTTFIAYKFSVPMSANRSVAKFWFQVDEGDGSTPTIHDNDGRGYILPQDEIIHASSIGTIISDFTGDQLNHSFIFDAGIRSESNFTRAQIHASDYSSRGSGPLLNTTIELQRNATKTFVEGYDLYTAHVATAGGGLNVDMEVIINGVSYAVDYISAATIDQLGPLSTITNITTSSISTAPGTNTSSPSSAVPMHLLPLVYLAASAVLLTSLLS